MLFKSSIFSTTNRFSGSAAKTGKVVNLKKGQFMSPESMKHAVQKVKDAGNTSAWITDRGTMFGYQDHDCRF